MREIININTLKQDLSTFLDEEVMFDMAPMYGIPSYFADHLKNRTKDITIRLPEGYFNESIERRLLSFNKKILIKVEWY